jgi:hypothetical protein
MKQVLFRTSPNSIRRKLHKVLTAIFFASVACSLTMSASPPAQNATGISKTSTTGTSFGVIKRELTNPLGTIVPTIVRRSIRTTR